MKSTHLLIATLLVTFGTFVITRYYFPREVEKVVTVEKEVIKEVTVTRTHQEVSKDGGIVTDTVTTSTKDEQTTKKEVAVKYELSQWLVSVGVNSEKSYSAQVQYRVLGPVFIGVFGSSDKTIGANIGFQF